MRSRFGSRTVVWVRDSAITLHTAAENRLMRTGHHTPAPQTDTTAVITTKILDALRGLRFGSVEITVHEGRIVQIERREKFRLNLACPETTAGERSPTIPS